MVVCGVAVASLSIMLLSSSMQTMPNFGGSNTLHFFPDFHAIFTPLTHLACSLIASRIPPILLACL
jgi:hypothetical protein